MRKRAVERDRERAGICDRDGRKIKKSMAEGMGGRQRGTEKGGAVPREMGRREEITRFGGNNNILVPP